MYAHPQHGVDPDEVVRLRRAAGRWLREQREAAGLTQRELAKALGIGRYAFISQIESGRGRIPPDRYEAYARALSIDAQHLARAMLRHYDPVTHRILFERSDEEPAAPQRQTLEERMERMEARLDRLERAQIDERQRR